LLQLATLQDLDLTACRISNEGVKHLRGLLNLVTLSLARTRIGDSGLAQLTQLPALGMLYVDQTQATDAGVASFAAASRGCRLSIREYGMLVQ
jgi:hypothetical protein